MHQLIKEDAAYSDMVYLYTSLLWGYPESIVACDIWHRSRCSGIEDAEALPPLFVHTGSVIGGGRLLRKVVRFFINIKES